MALLDAPYAFAATYADAVQRPSDEWAERASAASSGGSQAIFVAMAEDDPLGMVGAYTPDDEPRTRHVVSLWVEPAFRGQGLGRRLVETVVAWASAAGAERTMLWVAETNVPAVELYESMGFEETGDRQPMPSDPGIVERRLVRRAGREPSA